MILAPATGFQDWIILMAVVAVIVLFLFVVFYFICCGDGLFLCLVGIFGVDTRRVVDIGRFVFTGVHAFSSCFKESARVRNAYPWCGVLCVDVSLLIEILVHYGKKAWQIKYMWIYSYK